MLTISGLHKSYPSGFSLSVDDCEIGEGKVTALLGPNASGKSTLLRVIAGIETAEAGSLSLDGLELDPRRPAPVGWRRRVTLLMQSPYYFSGTVADNVLCGLRLRGCPKADRRRRLSEALARVGLDGAGARRMDTLSGGEAQRVAVARALVLRPRLLLLDEPAAGIDRDNAGRVERLVSSFRGGEGLTVILATHNIEQACRLADDVLSLIGGRVVPARPENVFEGTVEEAANGLKKVILREGVAVEVDTPLSGRVHVTIDPTDIILSRKRLESSARNCVAGTVRSVTAHGNSMRLAVEAGVTFSAVVTAKSYRQMNLHPGDAVLLTFKTTAVRVF